MNTTVPYCWICRLPRSYCETSPARTRMHAWLLVLDVLAVVGPSRAYLWAVGKAADAAYETEPRT